MAELKTKITRASVPAFLNAIKDDQIRKDCKVIAGIMRKATGAAPRMWGASIVGFGSYQYRYASGREGEWMLTAFSPRKQNITLYIMGGFANYGPLMARLGKHSCGQSCLYINRLSDIDVPTLTKLVHASVTHMRKAHRPGTRP